MILYNVLDFICFSTELLTASVPTTFEIVLTLYRCVITKFNAHVYTKVIFMLFTEQ